MFRWVLSKSSLMRRHKTVPQSFYTHARGVSEPTISKEKNECDVKDKKIQNRGILLSVPFYVTTADER